MNAGPGQPPPKPSPDVGTTMAHFYRGEVNRSNTWRTRLDATTNWAVVTTGAGLSFAFGGPANPAEVILIVTWLVLLFLFIEARRYRYYELWAYRVRLVETNYLAPILTGAEVLQPDWRRQLSGSIQRPAFPITLLEALGRRYRRNYAPLFLVLAGSWVIKLAIHPTAVASWSEFVARSAVGPVRGWVILVIGVLFNGALLALGLFTVGLRESKGEVLGEAMGGMSRLTARVREATREALDIDLASFHPSWRVGRKQIAFVISDEIEQIGRPLMTELNRGVTLLRGTGMHTGREHGVLMTVVRGSQVDRLREIVDEKDPNAFLVVTAAQDVRGEGFRPL